MFVSEKCFFFGVGNAEERQIKAGYGLDVVSSINHYVLVYTPS